MTEHHDNAKALKKTLKAQTKQAKKEAKAASLTETSPTPQTQIGLTPAERSAAAAEKQVRLQRWRVVLALVGVAIGVATILLSMRPWESKGVDQTGAPSSQIAP